MDVDQLEVWAARAAGGDVAATAALVRATQTDVWRLCSRLVDRQAADDLTQETYLRAIPALAGFQGRSSLRTWLLSIARRVCADHLRYKQRRRLVFVGGGQEVESLLGEHPAVTDEVGGTVAARDALDRLEPQRREAPYSEAAEVIGCPVGTIRSRVARARADLVAAMVSHAEPRRRA
ncbi:sigma-70 family RNA polymerase sigma factor [Klenkia terrae]